MALVNDWSVVLRCDVIRGQKAAGYETNAHWECWWIVAQRAGQSFCHAVTFADYELASHLLNRIRAHSNFTPEGKAPLWLPIMDLRPLPRPRVRWHPTLPRING